MKRQALLAEYNLYSCITYMIIHAQLIKFTISLK